MNHTPCWAFCESIPVLGYIWAYLLRKKILAVSFCGHLDHEKLRMLTRQSKKVAGPTPLQTDTPIDVAQWDCWKILKLWHTHWNVFHIPLNTYLANCYAISFCYLDNNISTWGPHKKKQHFGVQFPLKSLTVYFCIFLVKMFCRVLFSYIQNIQEKPFT